jgi:hypothetical protein
LEVKLDFALTAQCHPTDVWEKFCKIEEWHNHTEIFGQAGWVYGKPWANHSRFFIEMIKPEREDFEIVVLRSSNLNELMLLSHGGGLAGEQWISVKSRLETIMKFWFGGLAAEAERHCEFVAL